MVVGDILTIIVACERVGKFGVTLHNISKNIAGNFSHSTIQLGQEVEALSQRVTTVKTVLEDPNKKKDLNKKKHLEKLSGLSEVITTIEEEFHKIEGFFEKLRKYGGQDWVKYLCTLVWKYRRIQRQFQDFSCILLELHKELGEKSQDCTMVAVMETHTVVCDIRENQGKDFQKLVEMVKAAALPAFPEWFIREQEFRRGRFIPGHPLPKPIKSSEISKKKLLCQGTFGKYYTAVLDREKVVLKWIDDVLDEQSFAKETRNLIMVSAGSITRLFGMCDEETEKFLVMEYMERGSMSNVLYGGEKLTLNEMVTLASSAAKSVYRIHTMMVHTSLRTEKFLVDKFFTAKLPGMCHAMTFSSCKRYDLSEHHVVDISYYRAPELFEPGVPSRESDIYAFGIVLWEIFTQTKPFSELESELERKPTIDDLDKFLLKDEREEYIFGDQDMSTIRQLNGLIRKCRSLIPGDRPTISDIESALSGIEEALDQ